MGLIDKITTGKIVAPVRLVVHGLPSVGKSTFASEAPDHIFADVENRTDHLDLKARVKPASWDETLEFIAEVHRAKKYKVAVIDTLDALEMKLWEHICRREGVNSIEQACGGYGKGFRYALEQWRRFVAGLELLRSSGITTICLAHSQVVTYKNPLGEDYDRYELKLHKLAAGLFRETSDLIGFAHFEDFTKKKSKYDPKAKAFTTGERVLTFAHNPAFESKRGIPFADEISLSWAAFEEALKASRENGR